MGPVQQPIVRFKKSRLETDKPALIGSIATLTIRYQDVGAATNQSENDSGRLHPHIRTMPTDSSAASTTPGSDATTTPSSGSGLRPRTISFASTVTRREGNMGVPFIKEDETPSFTPKPICRRRTAPPFFASGRPSSEGVTYQSFQDFGTVTSKAAAEAEKSSGVSEKEPSPADSETDGNKPASSTDSGTKAGSPTSTGANQSRSSSWWFGSSGRRGEEAP
ncbi:hypothetical protein IAT40_003837 [Kwoniella sp. CBS 6097]